MEPSINDQLTESHPDPVDNLIEEVRINTAPHLANTTENARLLRPNNDELGYVGHRQVAATRTDPLHCDITIIWDAALAIPPVKIRGAPSDALRSATPMGVTESRPMDSLAPLSSQQPLPRLHHRA